MSELDELYVMARRVLLDAIDALGHHRDAIVLVGAQAVYLDDVARGSGQLRQVSVPHLPLTCSHNASKVAT